MSVTAIVLTLNEGRHLDRCLKSLEGISTRVLVIDSGSTDNTTAVADAHGATILRHAFHNYASQFNWALDQLPPDAGWVLRIDADEYLTPALRDAIRQQLPLLGEDVDGVAFIRRMVFQGRMIRFGGMARIKVLRLFRAGRGRCENRWMDEHIKVDGRTVEIPGELVDHNLNSLTWWTEKHNRYANREVVDLLNLEYGFMVRDSVAALGSGSQASAKRWLKESVYARLPGGARAFLYFSYRYVLRLGFLDGRAGTAFHVLQGFWYRYLVDAKVQEVKHYARDKGVPIEAAIADVLGLKVV